MLGKHWLILPQPRLTCHFALSQDSARKEAQQEPKCFCVSWENAALGKLSQHVSGVI